MVLVAGTLLAAQLPESYYRLVQEDEHLEWCTFWAFVLAGALHACAARALVRRRRRVLAGWFAAGVALFCWLVAMEEISWGQRVLGFRPPEYFLGHNYQQELNVHNLLASRVRKLGSGSVIVGYGILLPLAASSWRLRRVLVRIGVSPAPIELLPIFVVAFVLQVTYPIRFTGEWVELLLGLGFLFTPLVRSSAVERRGASTLSPLLSTCIVLFGLTVATTAWSRHLRGASPEAVAAARVELEALGRDLQRAPFPEQHVAHRRVYTYVSRHGWTALDGGDYRSLVQAGLPEERAQYALDPWNNAYWLRYERREDGRVRALLYSLGPNRMRETVEWQLGGDDIGLAFGPDALR